MHIIDKCFSCDAFCMTGTFCLETFHEDFDIMQVAKKSTTI